MRLSRTLLAALAAALLAVASLATSTTAESAPSWAPAATAAIHPGTMMYTDGAGNVYVGYAAHCAGKGAATDTNA